MFGKIKVIKNLTNGYKLRLQKTRGLLGATGWGLGAGANIFQLWDFGLWSSVPGYRCSGHPPSTPLNFATPPKASAGCSI